MQRDIFDLATTLYQACGSRLYRILPQTSAAQVLLRDGSDVETRLAVLERSLASNTTTRFADNIAQRDRIISQIPGDRVLVTDASADPQVGEGSALYIWLPAQGWVLVWQSASQLDISALVGSGLLLNGAGKLCVNWREIPEAELLSALAPLLSDSLQVTGGKIAVNFWQIPDKWLSLSLMQLLSPDFVQKDGAFWLRKLLPGDLPLAVLAGYGLKASANSLNINLSEIDLDDLTENQKYKLCAFLAGFGLNASSGKLQLDISGMSAVNRKAIFACLAGSGLKMNDEGRLEADFTQLPENAVISILRSYLSVEAPLALSEDGRLGLVISSSLALPSDTTAASSMAAYELNNKVGQTDHKANLNQLQLFGIDERLTGHIEDYEATVADVDALYQAGAARLASDSLSGLMSAQDKQKLDKIAPEANNYELPPASSTERGGVKTGYAANGKNYPVQLENEQMFVHVPWTDTIQTLPTVATLFTAQNTSPQYLAVFDWNFVNAGFLPIADAKNLFMPSDMTGASASANGTAGLVPAPVKGASNRYLRSDGTWQVPPDNNTTYSVATASAAGLCPKLGGGTANFLRADGSWAQPPDTNTTYSAATQSAAGLMSADDKKKLDGIAPGAQVNPSLSAYATTSAMNTGLAAKVDKAGDTMTGALTINLKDRALILKNPVDDYSVTPAASTYSYISLYDKNNIEVAQIAHAHYKNNGISNAYLQAKGQDGTLGTISIEVGADGITRGVCPTPQDNSNTVHMATTAWVRARIAAATGKGATTFALVASPALLSLNSGNDACEYSATAITPYMREAALQGVKNRTASEIYYGFMYEIDGELYYFTYDMNDQQNLADAAILAGMDEFATVFARNQEDRLVKLELAPADAKALFKFATTRKTALMEEARLEAEAIKAFTSYPELEYYLEETGALPEYEAILDSIISANDPPDYEAASCANNVLAEMPGEIGGRPLPDADSPETGATGVDEQIHEIMNDLMQ